MKKFLIVCAACTLLAAACDKNSTNTTAQAQLKLQHDQLALEQQRQDQVNVERCAQEAATAVPKMVTGLRRNYPSTQIDELSGGAQNHYNRQLHKCLVDLYTEDQSSSAAGYIGSEYVFDAYENLTLMSCSSSTNQTACWDQNGETLSTTTAAQLESDYMHN